MLGWGVHHHRGGGEAAGLGGRVGRGCSKPRKAAATVQGWPDWSLERFSGQHAATFKFLRKWFTFHAVPLPACLMCFRGSGKRAQPKDQQYPGTWLRASGSARHPAAEMGASSARPEGQGSPHRGLRGLSVLSAQDGAWHAMNTCANCGCFYNYCYYLLQVFRSTTHAVSLIRGRLSKFI